MKRYRTGFDGIRASADFKARMAERMLAQNDRPAAQMPAEARQGFRMPAKRRALLIAMAAVILLLTACTAYVLYWSSTQRARSNAETQINVPEEALEQQAAAYADALLQALTLEAPLSGTASAGGVTIALQGVEVFQDADGGEYVFQLAVTSDTVGLFTSLSPDFLAQDFAAQTRLTQYKTLCAFGMDAREFALTIDGVAYTPYFSPDYEGVRQPASRWNEPETAGGPTSTLMLWKMPHPIAADAKMNLSGTLYACDREGNRTGELGAFSIDFDYSYPADIAGEIREREVAAYKERYAEASAGRAAALDALPTAAAPVGLTQDAFTLVDVAVMEDGLLLGSAFDAQWAPADGGSLSGWEFSGMQYYLDGYLQRTELIDQSYEPDTAKPRDDMGSYPAKTASALRKVFYYRPIAEMPEEILVYLTREHRVFDGLTETVEQMAVLPLELAFYVNRRTGAVTLPGDDAEKAAWVSAHERLAADGRNDNRAYILHQEQTLDGMPVLLERMTYEPEAGRLVLWTFFPDIRCELMAWETEPTVTIDGVELQRPVIDTYYRTADASLTMPPPYRVDIEEWKETYDLTKKRFWWDERRFAMPMRITELPETFTLGVTWELYDLNEAAERTKMGTFHVELPIQRDDYLPYDPVDDLYERTWRRAITDAYGAGG